MAAVERLSTEAIEAWVADTEDRERNESDIYQPTIQAEVIPLACVWCLAKAKFDKELVTPFQFAKELIAHDIARETWTRRAEKAGDMAVELENYDFERTVAIYKRAGMYGPQRFSVKALEGGRTDKTAFISGVELSLLTAVGHAAYNSDVTQMIWLEPFGPPAPPHPDALSWFNQAGDHVRDFARISLNIKTNH